MAFCDFPGYIDTILVAITLSAGCILNAFKTLNTNLSLFFDIKVIATYIRFIIDPKLIIPGFKVVRRFIIPVVL